MGIFGCEPWREQSLIPPDEPETTECEVEQSEHLRRHTYKDGHIRWERLPHDPVGYDEDCWEEAYALGIAAADRSMRNLRRNIEGAVELGYSLGAYQAAEAFAQGRHHE